MGGVELLLLLQLLLLLLLLPPPPPPPPPLQLVWACSPRCCSPCQWPGLLAWCVLAWV